MKYRYYPEKTPLRILTAPFILLMIVPFVFLDVCLEIYHRICFPIYGIKLVRRSSYISIDRHKLSYLKNTEKAFCVYCGYANGLLHYATVIAAKTEGYWCGIKHSPKKDFVDPGHHKEFLSYGDEEAFQEFVTIRKKDSIENEQQPATEEG